MGIVIGVDMRIVNQLLAVFVLGYLLVCCLDLLKSQPSVVAPIVVLVMDVVVVGILELGRSGQVA